MEERDIITLDVGIIDTGHAVGVFIEGAIGD